MIKEWVFKNETDARRCADKVNGIIGHNQDYTEWYVHALVA